MGKASRTKRERRDAPEPGKVVARNPSKQFPTFWVVIAVLIIGGIVALVATRPSEEEQAAVAKAADAPVYADVKAEGTPVATYEQGDDPGVGAAIPTVEGTSIEGNPMTLGGADEPTVIVTVAHWCPHCQAEVPRIVEWAKQGKAPEGVRIVGLSTAVQKGQPNFPPAEWLAKEAWPYDTFVDDEAGSAATAIGSKGFPFITFVNADGTVAERFSGEMPIDEFDAAVKRIAS